MADLKISGATVTTPVLTDMIPFARVADTTARHMTVTALFDALADGGIIKLLETTTPSAVADYGKIYTKSDNKLYFQDGAGTEHEIAFA